MEMTRSIHDRLHVRYWCFFLLFHGLKERPVDVNDKIGDTVLELVSVVSCSAWLQKYGATDSRLPYCQKCLFSLPHAQQ